MAKTANISVKQPWRLTFGEVMMPPFILAFIALCFFYPALYIPLYLIACLFAYWIARILYIQYKWGDFIKRAPQHPDSRLWTGHLHLITPDTLITKLQEFRPMIGPLGCLRRPPGFTPLVTCSHAELFKAIMSTHNTPKGQIYKFLTEGVDLSDPIGSGWLGTGLLTSNGALWKSRRDMLTPTFHFKVLQNYMQIFNSRAKIFTNRLAQLSQDSSKSHDVFPLCTDLTLDIIGACAFGQDLGCQTQSEPSNYVQAIREISKIVYERTFHPIYMFNLPFKFSTSGKKFASCIRTVHQLPERLMRERRKYLMEHPESIETKSKLDFLDLLLTITDENGEGLDELAIRNEVDTFLFEGHDTTASALVWTLYLLASHPEHQRKLQEEVDKILGDRDGPTFEEAKNSFDFMDLVLKESLRLYPPVPFITRSLEVDIPYKDIVIPSGTEVSLAIYSIQRAPEYWKDPDAFKPERWTTETTVPFAHVPFSGGHRNCIGQMFAQLEEKVILAHVMKNFDLSFDHETCVIDPETHLILRPRNGIKLFMKPRKHQ